MKIFRDNKKNNDFKAKEIKERLILAAIRSEDEMLKEYENDYLGYSIEKVEENREKFGENVIKNNKVDSLFKKLFRSFINPFTVILIILSGVSLVTDVFMQTSGKKDFTSFIIVTVMVMFSGLINFTQEMKSSKASEKLGEMVKTTISVVRKEFGSIEIPISEIVVGDIINLGAGDMIPADLRILQAKDLFISESALTGESEAIEKLNLTLKNKPKNILETNNIVFMGSNVISGSAIGIVVNIGNDTIFGTIAKQVSEGREATTFDKGLNSISWLLIRLMMVMLPVVLFINGFTKGDWMEAFLFAISVAVGLTPEMLPMVVSTNLAKGALEMSKKKVIVKELPSIQNLGSMDVLCTDKTGTLTQDKIILEYSLDIEGNEDNRVLRHGFLNSYHQTGLKNLLDIAIINHAYENEFIELWQDYEKIDEIPFDFNRRRMSVVVKDKEGKTQLITKGAIEEMIEVSKFVEYKGEILEINDKLKEEILKTVDKYNKEGMRVLGVAQKNNPSKIGELTYKDEKDMVLIGYLAFLDPPKESTELALKALGDLGVEAKILTGDNDAVTTSLCNKINMKVKNLLLGTDIDKLSEEELKVKVENTNVFAKLSPSQKVRVVQALRSNGHTVGFMGDGINDAAALKKADVGISVDTAVDISKESANIILLEKDLMVLEEGIIEGRKIYNNIIKYIKLTASSNFGNIFSVLVASIFLPFLPMLPIQILMLNLIYDISCISMPWDNVDEEFIKKPKKWDSASISKFMFYIGPISSIIDILTFILLYFVICPLVFNGQFNTLSAESQLGFIALFNAGWFIESLWSQTMVIHLIRTEKKPIIESRASNKVTLFTTLGIIVGTIIPYTSFGEALKMAPLPVVFYPILFGIIGLYVVLVLKMKKVFIKKYGELL